jgi:hypothetical protein
MYADSTYYDGKLVIHSVEMIVRERLYYVTFTYNDKRQTWDVLADDSIHAIEKVVDKVKHL